MTSPLIAIQNGRNFNSTDRDTEIWNTAMMVNSKCFGILLSVPNK